MVPARGRQRFLFAAYHFPAYGTAKAPGPLQLPIDDPRSVQIRTHWLPHIDRYGVTAVFEHDNHCYKRTHRLRNHQRDDLNGVLYLGDGAWGSAARRRRQVTPRPIPGPPPRAAWCGGQRGGPGRGKPMPAAGSSGPCPPVPPGPGRHGCGRGRRNGRREVGAVDDQVEAAVLEEIAHAVGIEVAPVDAQAAAAGWGQNPAEWPKSAVPPPATPRRDGGTPGALIGFSFSGD